MCNTVFISTTSEEDLSKLESPNFALESLSDEDPVNEAGLLEYPNRWFLTGRHGGCSCHFRHVIEETPEKEFYEPYDWCPEDPENIEDTTAIYNVFERLIAEGHKLDVVDLWNGTANKGFKSISVSLSEVTREKFLFLENHRLILTP